MILLNRIYGLFFALLGATGLMWTFCIFSVELIHGLPRVSWQFATFGAVIHAPSPTHLPAIIQWIFDAILGTPYFVLGFVISGFLLWEGLRAMTRLK